MLTINILIDKRCSFNNNNNNKNNNNNHNNKTSCTDALNSSNYVLMVLLSKYQKILAFHWFYNYLNLIINSLKPDDVEIIGEKKKIN